MRLTKRFLASLVGLSFSAARSFNVWRCLWLILAFAIFTLPTTSSKSQAITDRTIYIDFSTDAATKMHGTFFKRYCCSEIAVGMSIDYSYIFLEADEQNPPNLRIRMFDLNRTIHIQISVLTPEEFDSFPFLESQIGYNLEIQYGYGHTIPEGEAIHLIQALALYSKDDCQLFRWNTREPLGEYNDYLAFYFANCALLDGDLDDAISYFEPLIRYETLPNGQQILAHNSIPSAINLSWLYFVTQREVEAFELIDEVVGSEYFWVGNCHNETSCPDPVIKALSRRAQLYSLAYRYDDAIADLSTALELTPDNPELYTLRGQMYLYLYEWDSSLADYNHALELAPDYANAYYYRAVLYYSILQTGVELRAEALADFQHYLELAPEGDHAADATRYIDQIQTELAALNE